MNEQPLGDYSEMVLLCVDAEGRFYNEEEDGYATWGNWLETPARAKRFDHFCYGKSLGPPKLPLHEPSYYFPRNSQLPPGCRMVWAKMNMTLWEKEVGPAHQKPIDWFQKAL